MKYFFYSFVYAFKGIYAAFREQRSLWVEGLAAVAVVIAGFYFNITATEWLLVVFSIGLVISLEMINTAIEDLVDLVTSEWKPLAGKIKDVAAGAVLIAGAAALIVGIIIFWKYFF
ncbi:MAG TPA: diacylglycerol kinase family protein [Chryseosolibacter sp.]|nr:diacylglycerol kinase family protein [Chryseosolibacter sp.]